MTGLEIAATIFLLSASSVIVFPIVFGVIMIVIAVILRHTNVKEINKDVHTQ